ncbi:MULTISPECIES: BrnA antitoxin family protein [Methylobacterium]|uniref:BrnA antitoxin family protein n=1 Tax=Methylobacterium TaxID=407 RepID=UPI0013EA9369|nr:BrnA antitoxin family protein [Methylobacterium sp. DB0501]NGM33224.1 BrnA antitoxin family protein [Methylobacterium sp. DB0501]
MSRTVLSAEELEQLAALAARPDHEIDTDDIPEAPAENWRHARRGPGRPPVEQAVTIRLDGDVVSWFKRHASGKEGYQAEISRVLRRYVDEAVKRSA